MNVSASIPAGARAIVEAEQRPLSGAARTVAEAIRAEHGPAVRALLFYGSALRGEANGESLFDFYVLVDSYRSVYGRGARRWLTFLAPPGVHYLEVTDAAGRTLRSKYSIVSLEAFHRRARGGALESMLWARFAQPTTIDTADAAERERLIDTLVLAARHFAGETAPLMGGPVSARALWTRGLSESYRTELRPEDPEGRAGDIVAANAARYDRLAAAFFRAGEEGRLLLPQTGALSRTACRTRWLVRRVLGKPMGALRVLKAALTFGARLDYVLEKLEKHSGVTIEVSEAERRRPVLHAPVLAWRLFRRGAFR